MKRAVGIDDETDAPPITHNEDDARTIGTQYVVMAMQITHTETNGGESSGGYTVYAPKRYYMVLHGVRQYTRHSQY